MYGQCAKLTLPFARCTSKNKLHNSAQWLFPLERNFLFFVLRGIFLLVTFLTIDKWIIMNREVAIKWIRQIWTNCYIYNNKAIKLNKYLCERHFAYGFSVLLCFIFSDSKIYNKIHSIKIYVKQNIEELFTIDNAIRNLIWFQ